jgi:ZIP family zinc transporter
LRGEHHHGHGHEPVDRVFSSKSKHRTTTTSRFSKKDEEEEEEEQEGHDENEGVTAANAVVSACACCSHNPVQDLENIRQMAQELDNEEEMKKPEKHEDVYEEDPLPPDSNVGRSEDDLVGIDMEAASSSNSVDEEVHEHEDENQKKDTNAHSHDAKLMRMSINTAIAIGLHNFPEGLATFVATLNDPKVGGVLGLAIAIHNIPEGLCVAMPVYYATGKRWNAFAWGVLSGISEPIAAVLGYAVLANSFSDVMYAVLFGVVAGMMVIISTRELLPTAHRYDPEDTVVTYSFIAGMAIIALSLVLFLL